MTVVPGRAPGYPPWLFPPCPRRKFTFLGFLPRDKTRKAALEEACSSPHTVILYESPHQLKKDDAGAGRAHSRAPHGSGEGADQGARAGLAHDCAGGFGGSTEHGEVRGEYVLILEGRPEEKAEAGDEEIAACIRRLWNRA